MKTVSSLVACSEVPALGKGANKLRTCSGDTLPEERASTSKCGVSWNVEASGQFDKCCQPRLRVMTDRESHGVSDTFWVRP